MNGSFREHFFPGSPHHEDAYFSLRIPHHPPFLSYSTRGSSIPLPDSYWELPMCPQYYRRLIPPPQKKRCVAALGATNVDSVLHPLLSSEQNIVHPAEEDSPSSLSSLSSANYIPSTPKSLSLSRRPKAKLVLPIPRHTPIFDRSFSNICLEIRREICTFLQVQDLVRLQSTCRSFREAVQSLAVLSNSVLLTSVGTIRATLCDYISLPEERLDIWNDPPQPPHVLPQSKLHGRCGALIIVDNPSVVPYSHKNLNPYYVHPAETTPPCIQTFNGPPENGPPENVLREAYERRLLYQQFQGSFANGIRLDISEDTHVRMNTDSQKTEDEERRSSFRKEEEGRFIICGGYGMFELWDQNVPMRCNEIWEYDRKSSTWALPGPMTEEGLSDDEEPVRFEDRDSFAIPTSEGCRLFVFSEATANYSIYHVFRRISVLDLPRRNFNKIENFDPRWPTSVEPFSAALAFPKPKWHHHLFSPNTPVPCRRESFARAVLREATDNTTGLVVIFGGYTSSPNSCCDLWMLEYKKMPTGHPDDFHWHYVHDTCLDFDDPDAAPKGRFGHTLTRVGSEIFLFGGRVNGTRVVHKGGKIVSRKVSTASQEVWVLSKTGHASGQFPFQRPVRISPPSKDMGRIYSRVGSAITSATSSVVDAAERRGMCRTNERNIRQNRESCRNSKELSQNESDDEETDTESSQTLSGSALCMVDLLSSRPSELNEWGWFQPICTGAPPRGRTAHRTVAIGCHLLVFAGFTSRYIADMYCLNIGAWVWSRVPLSPSPSFCPVYLRRSGRFLRRTNSSTSLLCDNISSKALQGRRKRKQEKKSTLTMNDDGWERNIAPRMEPGVSFDGENTIFIFGGINRYRWSWKQLRFEDFNTDFMKIKLCVEGDAAPCSPLERDNILMGSPSWTPAKKSPKRNRRRRRGGGGGRAVPTSSSDEMIHSDDDDDEEEDLLSDDQILRSGLCTGKSELSSKDIQSSSHSSRSNEACVKTPRSPRRVRKVKMCG